jgi:hypothetical protein
MKTSAKVAIGVTLALCAVIGFGAFRAYTIMHATVSPTHDYPAQIAATSRKSVQQWTPAADYAHYASLVQSFAQAHQKLLPPRESSSYATFEMTDAVDPAASPQDRDLALAILSDHEQAGRFIALAELPSLVGVTRQTLPGQPVALRDYLEVGAARSVARALHARALMQFRDGETQSALATVEQLLALSVITGSQPTMIDYLIGGGVRALATDAIRRACVTQSLDAQTAISLSTLLERYSLPRVKDVHLETERLILHDAIQWTYTDDGAGNGHFSPSGAQALANTQPNAAALVTNPFAAWFFADRKSVEERTNAYFAAAAEQASKPMRSRDFAQAGAVISNLGRGHLLLGILAPPLKNLLAADAQTTQMDRGVRILLALEAFEAQRGRLPDSLDQLVPEFIGDLPPDEWATDDKWVYRVATSPREDGRTFLLYSIGIDQIDQDGIETTPGVAALNSADSKADFVVNMSPNAMPKFD